MDITKYIGKRKMNQTIIYTYCPGDTPEQQMACTKYEPLDDLYCVHSGDCSDVCGLDDHTLTKGE